MKSWSMVGVWTGLAFATKENAYVTVVLVISTLFLVGFAHGMSDYFGKIRSIIANQLSGQLSGHLSGFVVSLSWFVVVVCLFYTWFFKYPEDWAFPIKAIRHWTEQHDLERVGGPWWYHLFRLVQYEFLILGAAFIWIFRRNQIRPIETGLFLFGILSIVMYAYLGEKASWLGLHQIWGFIPLAAAQLGRTFGSQGVWWSRCIASTALGLTLISTWSVNFLLHEITPTQAKVESIHYTQSTPEIKALANEIMRKDSSGKGYDAMISNEISWPLVWYLRHNKIHWGLSKEIEVPPIVVLESEKKSTVCELIACNNLNYDSRVIPLRAWWLPEIETPTFSELVNYVIFRSPWSEVSSTDVLVLNTKKKQSAKLQTD